MGRQTDERRPVGAASRDLATLNEAKSTVIDGHEVGLRARRHDFGILVTSVRRDGVAVQQVYTNLPAAERKRARCAERGLPCALTLVRLVPVHSTLDPADVLGVDL